MSMHTGPYPSRLLIKGHIAGLLFGSWVCSRRSVLLMPSVLLLLSLTACKERALSLEDALADPLALKRGEALFLGSCAGYCHGVQPSSQRLPQPPSQPPSPANDATDLFDCDWPQGKDVATLTGIIKQGIPGTRMVPFGENFPRGDNDIVRIIAYLHSKQPDCSDSDRQ